MSGMKASIAIGSLMVTVAIVGFATVADDSRHSGGFFAVTGILLSGAAFLTSGLFPSLRSFLALQWTGASIAVGIAFGAILDRVGCQMQFRTTVVFLSLLLVSSCSRPAAQADPAPGSAEIARLIRGTWCTPDGAGTGCLGYDYVVDDSTVIACGKLENSEETFLATSKYAISGSTICYDVISSSDARAMSPGDRFCAEIVRIDEDSETYRFAGEKKEFTIRRVQGPPPCAGGT